MSPFCGCGSPAGIQPFYHQCYIPVGAGVTFYNHNKHIVLRSKGASVFCRESTSDSRWACSVWVCWSFLAENVCVQTCGGVSWVFHPPCLHSPSCHSRHLFPYQMPHQRWDYKKNVQVKRGLKHLSIGDTKRYQDHLQRAEHLDTHLSQV